MRIAGLLLMVSGWALMPASLVLLPAATTRSVFLAAGCAVILLGLVIALRSGSTLPGAAQASRENL